MAEMADLFERKSLKLLAQAGQTLNQIVGEGLCDEPQKRPHAAHVDGTARDAGRVREGVF